MGAAGGTSDRLMQLWRSTDALGLNQACPGGKSRRWGEPAHPARMGEIGAGSEGEDVPEGTGQSRTDPADGRRGVGGQGAGSAVQSDGVIHQRATVRLRIQLPERRGQRHGTDSQTGAPDPAAERAAGLVDGRHAQGRGRRSQDHRRRRQRCREIPSRCRRQGLAKGLLLPL
ncbi:hypothetical protein DR999_PMT21987 [Platysternon megacephalum]|uniref:Uncharacterized protein n=1 Tax=Platysternon megacephalum TaxID=55544 RepID=A0A4D9DMV8_9SAUR|nr:hypothetical protein DR999_PMT21987 [Platysternon megacephalum]